MGEKIVRKERLVRRIVKLDNIQLWFLISKSEYISTVESKIVNKQIHAFIRKLCEFTQTFGFRS